MAKSLVLKVDGYLSSGDYWGAIDAIPRFYSRGLASDYEDLLLAYIGGAIEQGDYASRQSAIGDRSRDVAGKVDSKLYRPIFWVVVVWGLVPAQARRACLATVAVIVACGTPLSVFYFVFVPDPRAGETLAEIVTSLAARPDKRADIKKELKSKDFPEQAIEILAVCESRTKKFRSGGQTVERVVPSPHLVAIIADLPEAERDRAIDTPMKRLLLLNPPNSLMTAAAERLGGTSAVFDGKAMDLARNRVDRVTGMLRRASLSAAALTDTEDFLLVGGEVEIDGER